MPTLAEHIAEKLRKQFTIRNIASDARYITVESVIDRAIAEHAATDPDIPEDFKRGMAEAARGELLPLPDAAEHAAQPVSEYRMLNEGEKIQEGDQFHVRDDIWVERLSGHGTPLPACDVGEFRRKLPVSPLCEHCGKPAADHFEDNSCDNYAHKTTVFTAATGGQA